MLRERHDEQAFEVLEVAPTDEYLRHTLRVHGAYILKFNPDFVHDPSATHDAFLVQRGDETVGVVLLRETGADPDSCSTTSLLATATSHRASSCGGAAGCSVSAASSAW